MKLKQTILFIGASVSGIIGSFLELTHTADGDFLKGLSAGIIIVLATQLIPQLLLKRKNEIITK